MKTRSKRRLVAGLCILGGGALILWAERRRPLRNQKGSTRRLLRNVGMAGINLGVDQVTRPFLVSPVARRAEAERLGLVQQIRLPEPIRILLAVALLDWTLWFWHWGNHKIALLWRFHLVHHVDPLLDSTTALRFHFGEMALSAIYRHLQIRIVGAPQRAVDIWQILLLVSILFHHSNLRLPRRLEDRLVRWIVTPRMHAIHHSDYREETDSNWSSLLSAWDVLHGTMVWNVPDESIRIGVPAWREEMSLVQMARAPFRPSRNDWLDEGGMRRIARPPADDPGS